jgi:SPX domain protein involved in polyphosphate accumulation
MRYETKIPVSGLSEYQLESIIKVNKACFSEAYSERRVNNVYFDDLNMSSYFENLDGLGKRIKYRIRWYGEQFGHIQPSLELKLKDGLTGDKKIYKLTDFNFRKNISSAEMISYVCKNPLPVDVLEELRLKKPVLFNSYLRKYYLSFDKKIRLTLDKEISYSHIGSMLISSFKSDELLVIELKYDTENAAEARAVINEMPLRIDKNSKFTRGVFFTSK